MKSVLALSALVVLALLVAGSNAEGIKNVDDVELPAVAGL